MPESLLSVGTGDRTFKSGAAAGQLAVATTEDESGGEKKGTEGWKTSPLLCIFNARRQAQTAGLHFAALIVLTNE